MSRSVLRLLTGSHAGRRVKVATRRFVIGRNEQCDLRIPSDQVSRRHCELRVSADGSLLIEDLRSRNGTWVNEVRITTPTRVTVGDKLRIGKVVFEVVEVSESTGAPPSPEPEEVRLPESSSAVPRDPNLLTLDELVRFDDEELVLETPADAVDNLHEKEQAPIVSPGTTVVAPPPTAASSEPNRETGSGANTNPPATPDTQTAAKAALRSLFRRP